MGYLSKRRGVISVFLLIIFMITYVFMGFLVDAGRYHIAQTYVESSLDNASNSILSNYNQLVFDLYGLFSVDVALEDDQTLEDAIKEKYEHYLNQTLGLVELDRSTYETLLNQLFDEEKQEADFTITTDSLYDFNIESLQAGTQVTLADPANVESQIIEHMKYRAPAELMSGVGDLLSNLKEIAGMHTRINEAINKENIKKHYESLADQAKALLEGINNYANKLYYYTLEPHQDSLKTEGGSGTSAYDIQEFIRAFDRKLEEEKNYYDAGIQREAIECKEELVDLLKDLEKEMPEEMEETIEIPSNKELENASVRELESKAKKIKDSIEALALQDSDFWDTWCENYIEAYENYNNFNFDRCCQFVQAEYESRLESAKTTLMQNFEKVENNARALHSIAGNLEAEIETVVQEYQNYISELTQAKENVDDSIEETSSTIYDPEIQLAQANVGELLKNFELLLYSKQDLEIIYNQLLSSYLNSLAEDCIRGKRELSPRVSNDNKVIDVRSSLNALYSQCAYVKQGTFRQDVDVVVEEDKWNDVDTTNAKNKLEGSITVEATKGEGEEEISLDAKKIIENSSLLEVTTEHTESDTSIDIESEITGDNIDASVIKKVLNIGLTLINYIGNFLESGRDNLYVNAYVMTTFPNYKEHYKDGKEWETKDYLASYAEVEYIITGAGGEYVDGDKGFGTLSVESMRGRLFGVRTLLNALSMFTDSAKIQQANVLSAWAGPAAPLVAAVLLIGWIVAESVLDVMILMGDAGDLSDLGTEDGGIPIIKKSGDWLFSLNGVAKKLGNLAVNELTETILGAAEQLTESLESKMNVLIYKAYTEASNFNEATFSGLIDTEVENWSTELTDNLNSFGAVEGVDGVRNIASQVDNIGINGVAESTKNKIQNGIDDVKKRAVLMVSDMSDTVMEKTKEYVNSAGDKAKEFISENISSVVPVGKVAGGANATITMNYQDYLYFFLFFMKQETKIARIQSVIQANLNMPDGEEVIKLNSMPVSVWADIECSMKYMFLSDSIIPKSLKKDGRLQFKVISARSY